MNKQILIGIIAVVLSVGLALAAKPDFQLASVNPSNGIASVVIPTNSVEVAPGVFSLGTGIDKGRIVEGYAIVDYKKAPAKPGTVCGNNVCEPSENANNCPADCGGNGGPTSTCYGFLANGAKWKTVEPYIVNPANNSGLGSSFIADNLALDIGKWETATGVDVLGNGSVTSSTLEADVASTDGNNEVYFGSIGNEGAIAVTIVWGIFRGPPQFRELVEWDQVYDQVDFNWSDSGDANKMDFENIATHELGHSFGLDDLYNSECSEQTMFGLASDGETKKRTLESGDIAGVQALYS